MMRLSDILIAVRTQKWNSLVPASYRYVRETASGFVFIHPTKGFRHISKKRLGL